MKRYLKYIFIVLASAALAVSCLEELEPTPSMTADEEVAVLVPRVKSFTNQYVTKSDYDEAELTLTSLKVLVFNRDGKLVRHQDVPVDSRTISLNKSMLNSPENGDLTDATVVMLANMDLARLKKGDTSLSSNLSNLRLSDLEDYSYSHEQSVYTSLGSGFKGFPMIGGTTGVNLSPTSSTNQQAPVVVDLKILYAKVNFEISVDQGGENQRVDPSNPQQMQFQLEMYTVFNASAVTALAIPTNEGEPVRDIFGNVPDERDIAKFDEPTASDKYTSQVAGTLPNQNIATLNGSTIPFTFYMAESRYNHNLSSLTEIYPDDEWLTSAQDQDVKGWETLTEEQKKLPQNKLNGVKYLYDDLIQQYKPKLANVAGASPDKGLASYVLLKGSYTDYRGTVWDVNYKVYLGKDNSQNFHVDRNSEYTNFITIKGVRNDDSYGEDQVWLDHRVDVNLRSGQGADNCVTISRETLLDAHIEVRPLRIQWAGTTYDRVYAYLPTGNEGQLLNWIGIEKFTGDNCQDASLYCFNDNGSTGKRKYFTTSLINDLQTMTGELGVKETEDGRKFLDCYNNHCLWIYFDENTSAADREAKLILEFYKGDSKTATEEYIIKQRGLQTVGSYIVESYEEYLHSYDSADKYNLSTSPVDYTQQGLAWGLSDGEPLSEDIIVTAMRTITALITQQRYDYYHQSDVPQGDNYYTYTRRATGDWSLTQPDATDNFGTGLTFTDRAAAKRSMTVRDMGSIPENAYQYCLSKNKFHEAEDGNHTMDIHWYLPDVYELQNVLKANDSNSASADFGADAYYWSSQPSYTGRLTQNFAVINEVPANARAVSKDEVSDLARTDQHRIRCFYSKTGLSVDMSQRVPDGLGGNYSFILKGNPVDGYFHDLLATHRVDNPNEIKQDYANASYAYPTKENSYGVSGVEFEYRVDKDKNGRNIEGFVKDPADQNNWDIYTSNYYSTLYTYPGLTAFTTEQYWNQNAYRPTTTKRSETQTYESSSTIVFNKEDLSNNSNLKPLNDKLKISFGPANSANNKPVFSYDELVNKTTSTDTRYWEPPVYIKRDHDMEGGVVTLTETGVGETEEEASGSSKNEARQRAFEGYGGIWGLGAYYGAYEDAKAKALKNLKDIINKKYSGYNFNEADVTYTPLTWNSSEQEGVHYDEREVSGWFSKTYYATCTVTLTATVTITKDSSLTLYEQDSRTGRWGTPQNNTVSEGPTVNTDALSIFSGNSFTISCTDPNYEITKVKVVFSGKNEIDRENGGNIFIQTTTTYYARFVDSQISLPQQGDQSSHLLGMEYDDVNGWHQWSGVGRQSVTLTLRDFVQTKDSSFLGELLGSTWAEYDYVYSDVLRDPNWSFVIDRIEVKCSRKKVSTE